MKYKVGDKVIVVNAVEPLQSSIKSFIDLKGIVFKICEEGTSCPIHVKFKTEPAVNWGHEVAFQETEIEIYNEVGQQLLFSFMEEE